MGNDFFIFNSKLNLQLSSMLISKNIYFEVLNITMLLVNLELA